MAVSSGLSLLFTVVLAISTILLWRATKRLAVGAERQAADFKASIIESARSAAAMENVATHMAISAQAASDSVAALKERTAQQMRAYLSIHVGSATFQEREKGLLFEGTPNILNTGATPAHHVRYRAKAEIVPTASVATFRYPLDGVETGGATLNAGQSFIASAVVDHYIADQDVEPTKRLEGQCLLVWGSVRYEDIFGESHETAFGLVYRWLPDGSIFGQWTDAHNEAT